MTIFAVSNTVKSIGLQNVLFSNLNTFGLLQTQTLKTLHLIIKKMDAAQIFLLSQNIFIANEIHFAFSEFTAGQIKLPLNKQ